MTAYMIVNVEVEDAVGHAEYNLRLPASPSSGSMAESTWFASGSS